MKGEQHLASDEAHAGDWIEADTPGGGPPHRGLILEVLGTAPHRHYVVRWDEERQSIFFPADGARIIRAAAADCN